VKYTYRRVFTDPNVLLEMLKLRAEGENFTYLAKKYNVDHSSIIYQCQKYEVSPKAKDPADKKILKNLKEEIEKNNTKIVYKQKEEVVVVVRKKHKYEDLIFEKINKGKNYIEYLPKRRVPKKYRLD